MVHKILGFYVIHQSRGSLTLPKIQGWPWARASRVTALGLTSKLGLIPNFFKTLIILYYIILYYIYIYIYIYV